MPDPTPDNAKKLNLAVEFPPTPTAEWEATITKDLKGADYEKKLVWRTEEGFSVRPYYRSENLAGLEGQLGLRRTKTGWAISEKFAPAADAVRADLLHEAGATATQELGYAIAEGVEKLAALSEKRSVEAAAGEIEFVFAAGPSYFNEIAKLRAARLLWARVAEAFGAKSPVAMKIAVRTPRRNKSIVDHDSNLLRATTEALSAVLGGCDALYVEPFGFDEHIAVNIQRILQEESHLDAVADPAGGSYYIESLTDTIAREAWTIFQSVEAAGGATKAKADGSVTKAVETARAAREKSLTSRRKALVGVNNFPNLLEKAPEISAPKAECDCEYRVATPFEKIRQRTLDYAKEKGKTPKALLLTRGDVKMKGARSNFALNFFGCAGFEIVTSEEYDGLDADLIVLCSSDPEYLAFAQDVCPKVKVPVVVAGNPKDQIEALTAAGVKGFIHVLCDAVTTLTEWQDKLGMK
ncbi:MAG: methylmalonyl-CoA mutase family protein [Acidobacteriota bacterium]|jgi:methylmalonyl-CoA mutase|nr:methylmalonyl-CoA mutase family protein [Acidobacteriota bacterium]